MYYTEGLNYDNGTVLLEVMMLSPVNRPYYIFPRREPVIAMSTTMFMAVAIPDLTTPFNKELNIPFNN